MYVRKENFIVKKHLIELIEMQLRKKFANAVLPTMLFGQEKY